ncbi:hypothetical protein [Varibaculum massiliense]|uniref:hypothetical protein n=1 Tax=Varibaculum massiliense TaxID=1852372 RepID=UPI00115F8B84|nr:hypothetical protein [Varibaculum massiliense]
MGKHAKTSSIRRRGILALGMGLALSFSSVSSAMALWSDSDSAPGLTVKTEAFNVMGIKANGEEKSIFSKADVDSRECNAVAIPMDSYSASGKPFKVALDIAPKLPGYEYSVSAVDDPSKCSCDAASGKIEDISSTAKYACVVAKTSGANKEKQVGEYENIGQVTGVNVYGQKVEDKDTWNAKLTEKYRDEQPISAKVNLYREAVRCK